MRKNVLCLFKHYQQQLVPIVKMKTFLGLVLVVATVHAVNEELGQQLTSKAKIDIETCAKEVSASSNDVADIFAHKIPSTQDGKCVIFCLYKIYKIQNDKGSYTISGIFEYLESLKELDLDMYTKMHTVYENCLSTLPGTDPCTTAANLFTCFYKEKVKLGVGHLGF